MTKRSTQPATIELVGADANNLKCVDVSFPLSRISVVIGVSGSGKSSLLADTLAAEGARRSRTFLGASQRELEREDVRAFIGPLPPTVLLGQRGFRPSIRTTVGTASGILSLLRQLFVLASAPYSERARAQVPPPTPVTYARWISKHYRGIAEVWASPVRNERTDGVAAVKRLAAQGVEKIVVLSETDPPRLRESGRVVLCEDFRPLNKRVSHTIEAKIGRVEVLGKSQERRLRELLETAFEAAARSVVVMLPGCDYPDLQGPHGPRLDSTRHWVHPDAPEVFAPPSSHLLSYNAPEHDLSGACRVCRGTGVGHRLDETALVPNPDRSMNEGAFAIWTKKNYKYVHVQHETIEGLRGMRGFDPDVPWSKLPPSAQALVLDGSGEDLVFDRSPSRRKIGTARPFAGFRKIILDKAIARTKIAEHLKEFVESGPCGACAGTRWSPQALALRVGPYGIAEILATSFAEVDDLFAEGRELARTVPAKARPLVESLRRHGRSLVSVGLGYLTGDRGMLEVSEGESRRIRLARVLDAGERGFCLLLDEPARGLHESDLGPLSLALERLRDNHTVILNEHRERLWSTADWLVEVGPGAGAAGGQITYAGVPRKHKGTSDRSRLPATAPFDVSQPKIKISGASINNVVDIDCEIPLGHLTCICGVSGSGKTSFLRGVLAPALLERIGGDASEFTMRRGHWRSIRGVDLIREIVPLDQTMPPPNRRSLVATYAGVFDRIRKVFADSPAARREGLAPSDFGVNAGEGRCPVCLGIGEVLDDGESYSVCPRCGGSRYGQDVMAVRVADTNIHELLETPVEELVDLAIEFGIPSGLIDAICDLGIGYLALGRRLDTLSGGEVQRLRLALRLSESSGGGLIFLLDEPAVGLHPDDVDRVATALDRLLEGGRNTVVIVEHDLALIRSASWILEFGPGSGPEGGEIVYAGPSEALAKAATPTGRALAGKLPASDDGSPRPRSQEVTRRLSNDEQVTRTAALLRALIHGDAPSAPESDDSVAEPVVVISDRFWSGCEAWEVAGLDLEIPKLLLDVHRSASEGETQLLDKWDGLKEGWLAIQPFLADLQVWGAQLPMTTIRWTLTHLQKEGLRLVTSDGRPVDDDFEVRKARATGERFVPADDSREARSRTLRDAYSVGAHYVELRDGKGRRVAVATDRLVDLEAGIVGPMLPVPHHFSRLDAAGRCPLCAGARGIADVPQGLVIANRHVPPGGDSFLTQEASAILKGVCRNELRPFLQRLEKEGLWDSKLPFERLDKNSRELLLYGFWSRPGPGSFLKSPRANPAQVSSWLRWDGLYRRLLDKLERSRDQQWVSRVRQGTTKVRCVLCGGTGLRSYSSVLRVADTSFANWIRLPDHRKRIELLDRLQPHTPRQRRTLKRILLCLNPLTKSSSPPARAVVERTVEAFTTMPSVHELEPIGG